MNMWLCKNYNFCDQWKCDERQQQIHGLTYLLFVAMKNKLLNVKDDAMK